MKIAANIGINYISYKLLPFLLIYVAFLMLLHINSRITDCCANCNGTSWFVEKRFFYFSLAYHPRIPLILP